MHIHFLGICGTFMGGLAILARSSGHTVSGCDEDVYPPMSSQLEAVGINLIPGWDKGQIALQPDLFVVGNVVSRGNELIEEILSRRLPYMSGPQWLGENILVDKWVLAVAGTHGKTTVTAMLAWILDFAGLNPSFLIGGVPQNFDLSARLTDSDFVVVEADEYDTAFFDKRSKFVHYRPDTAILNNLEFDHADIFQNLKAIESQFHQLVRIVPRNGLIVFNGGDKNLKRLLRKGSWTPLEQFNGSRSGWRAVEMAPGRIRVSHNSRVKGEIQIRLNGAHNYNNALAALGAARHAGVPAEVGLEALEKFDGVKRRMELVGEVSGVKVLHDFAHHPTAIKCTLDALSDAIGKEKIILALEPRSNTMKMGTMRNKLLNSVQNINKVFCYTRGLDWSIEEALSGFSGTLNCSPHLDVLAKKIVNEAGSGDYILIMSNGSFGDLANKILDAL